MEEAGDSNNDIYIAPCCSLKYLHTHYLLQ